MKLQTLTREQVQLVREWRNEELQFLRTPHLLTEQMQDDFYDNVINNRDSKHRYFAIVDDPVQVIHMAIAPEQVITKIPFTGMGGLTNIEWENGTAEISLIINPDYRGKGYGRKAVELIRHEGLQNMRLQSVYGEVYYCGNYVFWQKIVDSYGGYATKLTNRKVYNGKLYDSFWFDIGVSK